jgi:hypothetical protein
MCLGGIMHLKPTAGCQISILIFEKKSLKSVKDPGNTFNISPKWARTLPSLINFHGIFRDPSSSTIL